MLKRNETLKTSPRIIRKHFKTSDLCFKIKFIKRTFETERRNFHVWTVLLGV